MKTTKLGAKMRALAGRTPKRAEELRAKAAQLDRAIASLGTVSPTSFAYREARMVYCQVTGRPWEWGADHDLDETEWEEPRD